MHRPRVRSPGQAFRVERCAMPPRRSWPASPTAEFPSRRSTSDMTVRVGPDWAKPPADHPAGALLRYRPAPRQDWHLPPTFVLAAANSSDGITDCGAASLNSAATIALADDLVSNFASAAGAGSSARRVVSTVVTFSGMALNASATLASA